jgi:hypothetical protein
VRLATLRRQCRTLIADIEVPRPFDLTAFCSYVARRRGRPLHLHPLDNRQVGGTVCGLWLATDRADHVFHALGTGPLHRQHIILHEIGHMLCDHVSPGLSHDQALALLLPDLDPATVTRVLGRSAYSAPQERTAEMVATLINERAGNTIAMPVAGTAVGNLHEALGDPYGSGRLGA